MRPSCSLTLCTESGIQVTVPKRDQLVLACVQNNIAWLGSHFVAHQLTPAQDRNGTAAHCQHQSCAAIKRGCCLRTLMSRVLARSPAGAGHCTVARDVRPHRVSLGPAVVSADCRRLLRLLNVAPSFMLTRAQIKLENAQNPQLCAWSGNFCLFSPQQSEFATASTSLPPVRCTDHAAELKPSQ